jgi:hypothetical protein
MPLKPVHRSLPEQFLADAGMALPDRATAAAFEEMIDGIRLRLGRAISPGAERQ